MADNEKDTQKSTVTPVLTDKVRGIDDPAGTPTTVTFLLSAIQTLFAVPRNVAVTQAAAPAWNCDNGDIFTIDALAQDITSMSSGQTGTPVNRQEIDWEITDNGTARAIAWGANHLGSTLAALPLTTILGKTLYVKERYNGSVWICLGAGSSL